MTTLPAANYMNDDARTQGEMKQAFEDQRQVIEDVWGVDSALPRVVHNFLYNPGFDISQRGTVFAGTTTPTNFDGNYTLDRWVILSTVNDAADVRNLPSFEAGDNPRSILGSEFSSHILRMTAQAGNRRFGILQILEHDDSAALLGRKVSFSFDMKADSSIDTVRIAILTWDGGIDEVTRDVVADWGAAGADVTFAANWTKANPSLGLAVDSTYTRTSVENITLPGEETGARNVAVFVWVDDGSITSGHELFLANMMLNLGTTAAPFNKPTIAEELARCQRYCWAVDADDGDVVGNGLASLTTEALIVLHPPTTMRTLPTFQLIGDVGDFEVDDGAAVHPVTALVQNVKTSKHVMVLTVTTGATLTQFRPYNLQDDGSSGENGDFFFDAEL